MWIPKGTLDLSAPARIAAFLAVFAGMSAALPTPAAGHAMMGASSRASVTISVSLGPDFTVARAPVTTALHPERSASSVLCVYSNAAGRFTLRTGDAMQAVPFEGPSDSCASSGFRRPAAQFRAASVRGSEPDAGPVLIVIVPD